MIAMSDVTGPIAAMRGRVLVADDQPDVVEAVRLLFKGEGFHLDTAHSPSAILEALESREYDVVLMDLNYARDTTSGREGLDLLPRIQALDSTLPVVVMTAWGSDDVAVEAMRRGARDFVQKPWDNSRLLTIVQTQVELGRALRRGQRLEAENRTLRDEIHPKLIADSPAMQPVASGSAWCFRFRRCRTSWRACARAIRPFGRASGDTTIRLARSCAKRMRCRRSSAISVSGRSRRRRSFRRSWRKSTWPCLRSTAISPCGS